MKGLLPILTLISLCVVMPARAMRNNDNQTILPFVFHDPLTKDYIYVESDGRHITAFTPDGVVLWHRNPFKDAHLKPYRFTKPVIYSVERSKISKNIVITFNSSQMVDLDYKTGSSTFLGQR